MKRTRISILLLCLVLILCLGGVWIYRQNRVQQPKAFADCVSLPQLEEIQSIEYVSAYQMPYEMRRIPKENWPELLELLQGLKFIPYEGQDPGAGGCTLGITITPKQPEGTSKEDSKGIQLCLQPELSTLDGKLYYTVGFRAKPFLTFFTKLQAQEPAQTQSKP